MAIAATPIAFGSELDVGPGITRKQLTITGSWTITVVVDKFFSDHWRLDQAVEAYRVFDTQSAGKGEFVTCSVWPAIAQTLGVPAAADSPCELKRFLPEKSALWDRIVTKHRLRPISLQELLGESHHLADFCFAYGAIEPPPPAFIRTIKIRQAGFNEVIDTEDMFRYWLANFIERRIVPGPAS